ncbi:MAG TPA: DUF6519 domain-containing protein [Polyangiaceae bacterium]
MGFDNSRFTFDPRKNYSGVVMEQGRVQLDADWNEWLAELARRTQAGTLDIFGHAAYPPTTPSAFLINVTAGTPDVVTIGCGRMYVDGLLAENHGSHTTTWDPALAERSNAPQPPDPSNPNPSPLDFTEQPYLPGAALPTDTSQSYLCYLDVWTRAVDYLQDPHLVDKAVAVDTTGRLQTVWQVKFLANTKGWTCATPDSEIFPPPVLGTLTTDVVQSKAQGPCCLTDNSGYTGVENQFYRVEIQQDGEGSDPASHAGAFFKWSRDNGSVETTVLGISTVQNSVNQPASALAVTSLGRDEVLGFKNGDWVELLDDWTELWGQAGILCQVDSVIVSPPTIILTATVDTTPSPPANATPNFPVDANGQTTPKRHTRLRRWDQRGKVYDTNGNLWCDVADFGGAIPVPASDTTLVLENGVTVQFELASGGSFAVGQFWTFAARTADGSVEHLKAAPPRGIHHHYTKLSIVTFGNPPSATNCRTPSGGPECGGCGCCTVTVGNGPGQYTSIQAAINALPSSGGEVCILSGRYFEYVTLYNLNDVVIYGCGAETRLASPSLQPGQKIFAKKELAANAAAPASGLSGVITLIGCTNVELRSFAVEADDGDAGILLDGTILREGFTEKEAKVAPIDEYVFVHVGDFSTNVRIHDLAMTASTLPALVSVRTTLLKFADNRVAMKDVPSQWPGVWVSGTEIHVERNWIGLQDADNSEEWMPVVVVGDVPDGFNAAVPDVPHANGGIQVAGYSQDVFIEDNEIEGGARNGISLGSFNVVSSKTKRILGETIFGLLPKTPSASATSFTLQLPTVTTVHDQDVTLVSDGSLQSVRITRNRIRNVGLCGIGPVGFFNRVTTLEVISAQDVTISDNVIEASLQDTIARTDAELPLIGYGAICLADVQNLVIRDNVITDFGDSPGTDVCGIFVLCGEQIAIDRNEVRETRDWSGVTNDSSSGHPQAGVFILLATPPALDPTTGGSAFAQGSSILAPAYQPGLPAVRVENNVVRVALGLALEIVGFGPFSVSGNQLSTGGPLSLFEDESALDARIEVRNAGIATVLILNLGHLIDLAATIRNYSELYATALNGSKSIVARNPLAASSSGSVLFSNNMCQIEARVSGVRAAASVAILSLDHILFSGNHCWVDGGERTVSFDALLFGLTLQANGNRFQESAEAVLASAVTLGLANMTTHNMATYCILAFGSSLLSTPNMIFDSALCSDKEALTASEGTKATLTPAVTAADTLANQRLQSLGVVQQARLAQLTRTAAVAKAQYGATSPQWKAAQVAVTASQGTVERLAVLNRQVAQVAPTAASQGWSLYGHVYNAQLQPAAAYTVFVVDAQNAYQSAIGFAYTASDGSYQLNYAPAAGATLPGQLFLQIANDKGQPVYLGSAALQPPTGVATVTDVTLPAGEPILGDPPAALRAIAMPPANASAPKGKDK